ncbi:MAG: translation initiation factor IF-2 [Bacteroidetes bacterium]|nr:translation initiation factor IF-2 [Bacteroidota bacterium]
MVQGQKGIRLSKAARELNVGINTIVEFLHQKDIIIEANPNTKISPEAYEFLAIEYSSDSTAKKESEKLSMRNLQETQEVAINNKTENEIESPDVTETTEEVLITDVSGTAPEIEKPVDRKEGKTESEPVTEKEPEIAKSEKKPVEEKKSEKDKEIKVVGKIDLDLINKKTKPEKKPEKKKEETPPEKETPKKEAPKKEDKEEPAIDIEIKETKLTEEEIEKVYKSDFKKLSGPTVVGKIDLPVKEEKKKPVASSDKQPKKKKKRKRIKKDTDKVDFKEKKRSKPKAGKVKQLHPEVNEEDVQKQIKETLAKLTSKGKSKGSKYRREKRDAITKKQEAEDIQHELEKNIIKVTEFVSVSELASMMNVESNEIISTCMNIGLLVSINQRLDAETIALVANEFNYEVEFISVDVQEAIMKEEDHEEDMKPRPPIVTVMGHVDHGKTKLLDHIRKSNIIAGEAGGITQHIGAYSVNLGDNRKITFLDTPGHEAFTAMRARGAQITDIAIIVVAADDGVKPQTVEAINHAHAAGVPIVFAINKIDKPAANAEKVKEELANMNFLVEDWGGKYQSQDISAKNGINIDELLEKVLLEAEMLELKANPDRKANGTIIESSLDKGRGYVATILVEGGILKIGDIMLAGSYFGHIKAMFNERDKNIEKAGPATPTLILGLNGAPQAGDTFNIMNSNREARDIATRRGQLQREQGIRTQKHITLDEIGRRIAIGNFQELNIIIKGDVDGSVEALSDSLIKLSTDEIHVNVIHKAVGQISESDILLAAASNALIIGFQVRPSMAARKLAEKEEIEIRLYSIIYDAIEELKSAMEGMLSPEIKEKIVATLEILEIFKITKAGTIAGCMVKEGKIVRDSKVRVIRDGIVVYSGELGSLKRFKDDVKEVVSGLECGLNVTNFNDIKAGDTIEAYTEFEVKKTL